MSKLLSQRIVGAVVITGFVIAVGIAGCGKSETNSRKSVSTAPPPPPVPSAPPEDWTKSLVKSAMDGDVITVSKDFKFPDEQTLIKAILTCKVQTKSLKISFESYTPSADGSEVSSPFATVRNAFGKVALSGRVKFGLADPEPLFLSFDFDNYRNVIAGNLQSLQSQLGFQRLSHQDVHGSGNLLKLLLPMVIEVNNDHGAVELTIPQNSGNINTLADACMEDPRTPLIRAAEQAVEEATGQADKLDSFARVAENYKSMAEYTKVEHDRALCEDKGFEQYQAGESAEQCKQKRAAYEAYMAKAKADLDTANSDAREAHKKLDAAIAALEVTKAGGTPQPTSSGTGVQVPEGNSAAPASAPAAIATAQATPSFDCTKASSAVEKLICSNSDLAAADADMAVVYKRNIAASGENVATVKQEQRVFIATRNQCSTAACIADAYRTRQEELAH